jgi:C_GCAxxG_C_C family probable redox protein
MSSRTEVATTRFLSGYNCAQAVLDAFRDEAGLDEDLALKIATGLGAGMGRKQEVCGAVTGGDPRFGAAARTWEQGRPLSH